jgi:5'-3' exonuclease
MKQKYTLLIDGTFFLFRTLYVTQPKGKEFLATKKEVNIFVRKLATDFSYQVRQFSNLVDDVVWTIDSKSWRKDFYPESDYKGNRKQDSSINWKNFSEASDAFLKILKEHGVTISKTDGAEGDDLIYAWNTELSSNGKSSIIITGDKDLIQLVGKNINDTHTLVYSPIHKKLYTFNSFTDWVNEHDEEKYDEFGVVDLKGQKNSILKKSLVLLIKEADLQVSEIDPVEFIYKKVLTGDSGDNVMPAYYYMLNGRKYGISDKKATEIVKLFKEAHPELSYKFLYDSELLHELSDMIIKIMKVKNVSREKIVSGLRSNTNLMVLSSESIPSAILDDIFNDIESIIGENKFLDIKTISSMNLILEGTEFLKEPQTVSSIFQDADDSEDFSFIK